jgi:4TM region of DNA translocase FtsK/SpoIIIE
VATRRRRQARRRRSGFGLGSIRLPDVGKDVARSLVGISLLVLGAVTLIAFLPGEGSVTTWFKETVGPWFGSLRWLLPVLLLATGWYIEWGPGKAPGSGWGLTLLGVVIAYLGLLGAASVVAPAGTRGAAQPGAGGGIVGTFMAGGLSNLVTDLGAFVLLVALGIAGLLIAFNLRLSQLLRPMTSTARWVGGVAADSLRRKATPPSTPERPARGSNGASPAPESVRGGARPRGGKVAAGTGDVAGQTGIWGEDRPPGTSAPAPTSATFAPPRSATAVADRPGLPPDLNAATAAALARRTEAEAEPDLPWRPNRYQPPGRDLLDDTPEPVALGGEEAAHRWTEE